MAKKATPKVSAATQTVPQPLVINPFGPTKQRTITKSQIKVSIYTLDDGTKLHVKPIVSDVRRALGQYNHQGQPLYFLTLGQVIETKALKKLQKPKK